MKNNVNMLLNQKATKKYILRRAKELRTGWDFTRVSQGYLDNLNYSLQRQIDSAIKSHPSIGKTIKP